MALLLCPFSYTMLLLKILLQIFILGLDIYLQVCDNAAMGGVTLCAGLRIPICQSAGRSRKDLNHCPTRVNITANRLEVPAVGDSLYNGFISND